MSDFKDLIANLHLEDIEEDKTKSISVFDMSGYEPQPKRKYKKHIGPDNRGKWQRTSEYNGKKSLEMQLKWQEPEWKEYMKQQQKGVPHVFTHGWSEESKKRYSEKLKNTIWINDGNNNKRQKNDQPIPEGWHRGRIKKRSDI